jgi:hypothetical protein
MSALGQKRTNHHGQKSTFVRYCPKADKHGRDWIVRFVPQADIQEFGSRLNSLPEPKMAECEARHIPSGLVGICLKLGNSGARR